jgi:hypothetical protein
MKSRYRWCYAHSLDGSKLRLSRPRSSSARSWRTCRHSHRPCSTSRASARSSPPSCSLPGHTGPRPLRSRLRSPRRRRPAPRLQRPNQPAQTQPRRRPSAARAMRVDGRRTPHLRQGPAVELVPVSHRRVFEQERLEPVRIALDFEERQCHPPLLPAAGYAYASAPANTLTWPASRERR